MENIEKGELITTGKAKSLYESNESDYLIMHYRDDTSAFDGKKMKVRWKGTIYNHRL
jgi:Phosphoribosylaminoimidazolesuccinocarboxamide (SAICAR) synthase